MSVYWNQRVMDLVPYVPGEQPKNLKFSGRKLIKLNTNENPYPPSPLVIEAIQKAAGETLRLYPDPACTELREAAAARYGIKRGQVFAGNGSDEILAFVFAAFFGAAQKAAQKAGEGGGVSGGETSLGETNSAAGDAGVDSVLLFPDITYSFYPVYADLWDIPYRTVPLKPDFSMDINAYLDRSGGIIFPNPNAPTGMAIPFDAVRKIAEAAEKNKRVLVVDEAYIAFADGEGIASALPLIDEFPNLLIVRTLSKEASLAGLRVGFALGAEDLIEGLCRIRDSFNSYTLDRLAQAGATAAIRDVSYYDGINRRVIATRRRLSLGLDALGFRVLPSQTNFLFAAPPAESGKSGQEFFAALRERGILVRHFNKPRIADFLRISMGTDEDMDIFLEVCGEILHDA